MSFFRNRFLSMIQKPEGILSPPVFFSCLPVLETEDLILRKPSMKDAKDIYRYASDPEVARYVLWNPHRSVSESRSFIRWLRGRIRAGYPSSWVAELKKTGIVIGTIGFIWYSEENRSAELGYRWAMKKLIKLYADGRGTERDPEQAEYWKVKSAAR